MPVNSDDRLLPWWLERQLDPSGPDVVPGAAATQNTTHRNWVQLGTVGAPERGVLDPRGLLTPWPRGWSVDWWAGADDRWHLPSRAVGVRQRLLSDAPVVETALRIPSGELLHRAWAVAGGDGVPAGGAVVVELENASPVPVAIAVAVRPWNPVGPARIDAVDLDGTTVVVDGLVAMVLPRGPSRVAVGDAVTDSLAVVLSGDATGTWPDDGARCRAGEASAAFLFPLPHTAVLRVLVPLVALPVAVPGRRRADLAAALATVDPRALPDAERVASGWEAQVRRAPRIELPERDVGEALAATRRHLLLHSAGDDAASWPPVAVGGFDTAALAVALDHQGLHTEAERLIVGFADRQNLDGSFAAESHRADAAASWMWAVGEHVRLSGRAELAVALVGPLAKAAHHVQRRHKGRRARRLDGRPALLPPGGGPSWLLDDAVTYHDALWSWRGLLEASFALDAAGQPEASAEVRSFADDLALAVAENLLADAASVGAAGPDGGPDGAAGPMAAVATLVALGAVLAGPGAAPTGAHDAAKTIAAALAERAGAAPAVWHGLGHAGSSPRLTAGSGRAEAVIGRPDSVARLRWLLDVGSPVWAWPQFVHPRTGGGSGGQGHDGPSTAAVLDLVRALAAVETADGVAMVPSVPAAWYGQPIEAHGLPTGQGTLSFAVRWHGERPALLWELEPHADPEVAAAVARLTGGPAVLRAPGLDPAWSTTELRGETLLGVPPLASGTDPDDDEVRTATPPAPPGPASSPAPPRPASSPAPPTADPPDAGASFT